MTLTRAQQRAHTAVNHAISTGALIPQPCERCGGGGVAIAHHDDYDLPLEVRWLCRSCHAQHHREQGAYANNGRKPGEPWFRNAKGQSPGAKFPAGVARERVREYRAKGLSARDIARLMDVSTQNVHYHLRELAKEKAS